MRGSSLPLTVAAYTPPTDGGVAVGWTVADAGVRAALGVGEAVAAPGLAGVLAVGVGEVDEQALPMSPTRTTSATRRVGIGAECRPSTRCGFGLRAWADPRARRGRRRASAWCGP